MFPRNMWPKMGIHLVKQSAMCVTEVILWMTDLKEKQNWMRLDLFGNVWMDLETSFIPPCEVPPSEWALLLCLENFLWRNMSKLHWSKSELNESLWCRVFFRAGPWRLQTSLGWVGIWLTHRYCTQMISSRGVDGRKIWILSLPYGNCDFVAGIDVSFVHWRPVYPAHLQGTMLYLSPDSFRVNIPGDVWKCVAAPIVSSQSTRERCIWGTSDQSECARKRKRRRHVRLCCLEYNIIRY